ncbi:hypothetical protein BN1708_001141 [Verticillium longisporum]|uniref:Major facilitator superfamily (MFS) profile domain-containing protein n=3 Tax=Verticillium longisporum TaxID=100787 RepID=A0A0G4MGP0_VERLO|nr:hypothetical protein BN1708_001141 [Verticillium longisporum]
MFTLSNHYIFQHFYKTLALSSLVIAISTLNYGFDNNSYMTSQAVEPFIRHFGSFDTRTGTYELPTAWLSMFKSLNYIGFAFGLVFGSLVSERWGRRWCMFSMSTLVWRTHHELHLSRDKYFIHNSSLENSLRPLLYSSYDHHVDRVVHSGRKVEKAHGVLVRLRPGTLSPEKIESEFAGLQLALRMEKEQERYTEIFQVINRKQTAVIVALSLLQQATGQAFVGSYGAIFVRSVVSVNPFK